MNRMKTVKEVKAERINLYEVVRFLKVSLEIILTSVQFGKVPIVAGLDGIK